MSAVEFVTRHALQAGLRLGFKLPSGLPLPVAALRQGMELGSALLPTRADVSVETLSLGGVRAERVTVSQPARVILHLHGGAFFVGSPKTHRALAGEFAARSQAEVYVLDYRLAPEHPYPAALDDGLAAYDALLAQGHAPENIVLSGDSCGGAHILALAVHLRQLGRPLPAALVMLSPFLDLTLTARSFSSRKRRDPMLTAHVLRRGGDAYRRAIPANDARLSPLFADLRGLPTTLVQVGSEEVLLDDALRFTERGRNAGMTVDCQVYAGMWHVFQLFSPLLNEADQAVDDIAAFITASTPA